MRGFQLGEGVIELREAEELHAIKSITVPAAN